MEYTACVSADRLMSYLETCFMGGILPLLIQQVSRYDIKHSDGEAPAQELSLMWSTSS